MGAEFITEQFDGNLDSIELKNRVVDMISNYVVERDDYDDDDEDYDEDYGCDGYSGTWKEVEAECFIGTHDVFNSYNEAAHWLANHCHKWGGAIAVRYYSGRPNDEAKKNLEKDKKLASLQEKYEIQLAELKKLEYEIELASLKTSGKSAKNPIINAKEKLEATKKAYLDRKRVIIDKSKGEKETVWLVGAWASC